MAKQKLKWTDTEEIAFRLIDAHPSVDPLRVRFTDLHKYITSLPEFGDNPKKSSEGLLEGIQMRWHEERAEMEDELGPVSSGEEDDLDEDDYRDDEEAGGDDSSADSFDDDEEEDEFGDGFQEEEVDDDR
jgi:FeS assembly protein IscX